ncbi:hypothetical protein AMS68_002998 [Peltaster fructicola]|uniref:DUF7624 domain-containing protein n=1 Tax=Peltaster fructicola TaxID=286661 RepID=A0A6H0XS48_9PEZI|nr:hypothetical protein AMS68_002998 [Peltaster fructicola]
MSPTSFLLSESPASTSPYSHRFSRELKESNSNRSSTRSDSLAPPQSPYPQVEPSPVDSNGTDGTEIDEAEQEEGAAKLPQDDITSPDIEIKSPGSTGSDKPSRLDIQFAIRSQFESSEDGPQSVIHAPSGFRDFSEKSSSRHSDTKGHHIASPATPEAVISGPITPLASPLNTDVARVFDRSTPLAQTRSELEQEFKRKKRASMLEDIPESNGKDAEDEDDRPSTAGLVGDGTLSQAQDEAIKNDEESVSLTAALGECWTLCNTLANLSSSHRLRTFQYSGKQELQEQAWRSCWRLCQKLYESKDENHTDQVVQTLELCRDFCQSLFEVRQRGDAASDSVLRVSFELNNHLYNTHDRTLPDAFSERTLDFYITLCHRLTKQRTSLPQEIDALLRACWNLAEMLFNLRQSRREGRAPDEEQLGSAVQACWDLCDLFREGWSQIRPDRGTTPRPKGRSLPSNHSTRSTERSTSSLSDRPYVDAVASVPETPTTIFDDTTVASSPDETNAPDILVLGPARPSGPGSQRGGSHHERWSSNASVMSDYSESAGSQRSTSTATAGTDEIDLLRLKYLLIKAAMNTGWTRTTGQQLPTYAQTMSKTAFGTLPWQIKVFGFYQKLVMNDTSMSNAHTFASRKISAVEMAESVKWLSRKQQWAWMRDLFRIVFGFGIDEAERRGGSIQV